MPLVTQQLRLTDSADVSRSIRWRDAAGDLYVLASVRLVVRATEDEEDDVAPLLDVAAVLSEGDTLATVTITKEQIAEANFTSPTAVWEMVAERASDGYTISAVGGPVVWSRGVARP